MGKNLTGRKIGSCAANARGARAKRIELLKFRLSNVNNFVWDPDKSVKPKCIQILPKGPSHLFGLISPNLKTEQDKIVAFMATIGNSVYAKEFNIFIGENIPEKFYLEASATLPLVCYKWKINVTLYNITSATTNNFYHHKGIIYSWCNDGYCKPVDKSCILCLPHAHFYFIGGKGTEVPTIDLGEMVYCEDTRQEGFDTMPVNAIQVNEDDEKESDKDSGGNSMEKMPKKKVRKFVSNNFDHKAPDNDLVAKTTDSGRSSMKGEKLDEDFQLESDTEGGNGTNDGNNDGNKENQLANRMDQKRMIHLLQITVITKHLMMIW